MTTDEWTLLKNVGPNQRQHRSDSPWFVSRANKQLENIWNIITEWSQPSEKIYEIWSLSDGSTSEKIYTISSLSDGSLLKILSECFILFLLCNLHHTLEVRPMCSGKRFMLYKPQTCRPWIRTYQQICRKQVARRLRIIL